MSTESQVEHAESTGQAPQGPRADAPEVRRAADRIYAELHGQPQPGVEAAPESFGPINLPENVRNLLMGLGKAELDAAVHYVATHFASLIAG